MTRQSALIWVQWITIILMAVINFRLWETARMESQKPNNPSIQTAVYSPAQHLTEKLHDVVFTSGLGAELSIYQGPPSPSVDQAWSDLYNFGISRIPMSDAAQIANRTVPIPDDPGYYAVGLDVFHQLHCLNMVRRRVWSTEIYDPLEELMGIEHIDHCIDTIRQSLMCHADVVPLPFAWIEEERRVLEVARVLHSCRDFEAIRRWGEENHIREFNRSIHVYDPLDDDPNVRGIQTFE